ncbi:MAG: YCF48-related protein, partial [Verrucomicrobia bacterium]|nr:YCF48-related protein [Verrucomicrobiota bacterium]
MDYVIDTDLNLYGNFSLKSYLINVNTNGGQVDIQLIEGSKVQDGYSLGSRLKISAINDSDYLFTGWTGDTTSNETELELTLNSDISLSANFVELNPLDTENSFYDIEFVTDQVGFISASNVIYKTIDGGKSWDIIVSEEGYYFKNISFQDESIGYYTKVADPYATEYLFVTKNGGLTWERLDLLSHFRSSTLNIKYEESVDIILESTNTIIWGINNRCNINSLTSAIDFSNNNGVSWDRYDGICLDYWGSYVE